MTNCGPPRTEASGLGYLVAATQANSTETACRYHNVTRTLCTASCEQAQLGRCNRRNFSIHSTELPSLLQQKLVQSSGYPSSNDLQLAFLLRVLHYFWDETCTVLPQHAVHDHMQNLMCKCSYHFSCSALWHKVNGDKILWLIGHGI